jgi:endonuclease YncB( thermonuclease family)
LNNALVRQGLATTANPFYKSWEEEARKNKRGMWRDKP